MFTIASRNMHVVLFGLAWLPFATATDSSDSGFIAFLVDSLSATPKEADDVVMLLCHDSVAKCKHMTESFRKLTTIWDGMGTYAGVRFVAANCADERGLCDREGVNVFPTVLRYKNGERVASWTVEGEETSMVWQFVAWVKDNLSEPARAESGKTAAIMRSTASQPDATKIVVANEQQQAATANIFAHLADMDKETATVGWCLVVAVILIVAWVIVEPVVDLVKHLAE